MWRSTSRNISGPLTIDNIVNYANQQLSAAGLQFALQPRDDARHDQRSDQVELRHLHQPGAQRSDDTCRRPRRRRRSIWPATAVQRLATSTASGATTYTTTAADQQGRLDQADRICRAARRHRPSMRRSAPTPATRRRSATVVDGNGNVYTVGTATGDFGNELNQGTQDVVLTKYDSAGNLQWTKLLGSAGSADSYSLALDPSGRARRRRFDHRQSFAHRHRQRQCRQLRRQIRRQRQSELGQADPDAGRQCAPTRSASMPPATSISAARSPA